LTLAQCSPHYFSLEKQKMKRIVIALGGNALQEAGKPATAESQLEVVEKTSEYIGFELRVILINNNLRNNSHNALSVFTGAEDFLKPLLHVVADVALAHCTANVKGHCGGDGGSIFVLKHAHRPLLYRRRSPQA